MKLLAHKSLNPLGLFLLMLLFTIGCKKDVEMSENQQPSTEVVATKWLKTSDFVLNHQVYDAKLLANGKSVVLADKYYIFDSFFNNVSVTDLYQNTMSVYQAKRLSNPFYTNRLGADGRSSYLIQNYFDENNGKINSQNIVDFTSFFPLSDKGYGILLDDKEDKILKKSIRLFLKTDQDSIPDRLKQLFVLTKKEANANSTNVVQKEFSTGFYNVACTKKNYLLYAVGYEGLMFLDPSFNAIDTTIYKNTIESVFATDDAFYIKNNYGLFETVNGTTFMKIVDAFAPKCMLPNDMLFGLKDKKPCLLDLNTKKITYLPTNGLTETLLSYPTYAISSNKRMVLFTREGVYQIKL